MKVKKTTQKTKSTKVANDSEGLKKTSELRTRIQKEREELNQLMLEKSQFKLKNTTSIRTKRDQIARLLTALKVVETEAKV